MSESEYGKSDHLSISAFLKHLMMLSYGVIIFQGFIFIYTLSKTHDSM